MKIRSARLCNFRNVELSEAGLDSHSVWVCGDNAQGKTNLLESVGMLSALRSFRTSKTASMIRHGQPEAQALFKIFHETLGECEVLVKISQNSRKAFIDDVEQKRLGDFLGLFPAVALSNDDIKLVRGAPLERRKFADILISSLDPAYFSALRAFHSALAQRNALLKKASADSLAFDSFEAEMARRAFVVSMKRREYFERIGRVATEKYALLSGGRDAAAVRLKSAAAMESAEAYRELLKSDRAKDALFGSTSSGPHRDDFLIFVSGKNVREFASEGQQRSVALSLRLAQFDMLKQSRGVLPVLLCDDILGELDARRRAAFWECADPEAQVIATSTAPAPQSMTNRSAWKTLIVRSGEFFESEGISE